MIGFHKHSTKPIITFYVNKLYLSCELDEDNDLIITVVSYRTKFLKVFVVPFSKIVG